MPTYTYRCKTCNEVTEVKQSINDEPLTHCLKCNGEANRIITSNISIQFKGSGFYCTDSK
ncbi:MAG: FmdB family zinc ribbon protein [Candidatus Margulisiibacteriota bacterium]|nr:FmdB family zinc ribbon protein [Candidatus Margulisiibacteriota bacterium]